MFDMVVLPRQLRRWRPDVTWSLGGLEVKIPGSLQVMLNMRPQILYGPRHNLGHGGTGYGDDEDANDAEPSQRRRKA
jgi:hypothetical protein